MPVTIDEDIVKPNIRWGIYELTRELLAAFDNDSLKLWWEAFERSRERRLAKRIPAFYIVNGSK